MSGELDPVVAQLIADTADFVRGFREAASVVNDVVRPSLEAAEAAKQLEAGMRDAAVGAEAAKEALDGTRDKAVETSLALDELRDKALEAAVAMRGLGDAQKSLQNSGDSGNSGGLLGALFSKPGLITAGIGLGLAGLPALAAAGGAATGIALGAGLLIGTQQVQGPLYQQFHTMLDGLVSVVRLAALPLVAPLAGAFRQIAQWAQLLKPELAAVFGSLGPMVMPFTQGLEGLISGVLPGFLNLMRAGQPAMQAFAGLLSQTGSGIGKLLGQLVSGVGPASKFLSGLSGAVNGLLPLVGTLSNTLATGLAPVMESLGTQFIPQMAGSVSGLLIQLTPLLKSLGQLTATLLPLLAQEIGPIAQGLSDTLDPVISGLTGLLDGLNGRVGTAIGLLNRLAQMASPLGMVFKSLSDIGSLGPHAAQLQPGAGIFGQPQDVSGPIITSVAQAEASYPYSSAWASGITSIASASGATSAQTAAANAIGRQITAALGSGVRETIPAAREQARLLMADIHKELTDGAITQSQATSLVNGVDTALAAHIKSVKAAAAKLGQALTDTLASQIASSTSASAMKTAVGKLLDDIKTAYDAGVIDLSQDKYLSAFVADQGLQLEQLAGQRAKITAQITAAKQFAAQAASSVAGAYTISSFATSGANGGVATVGQVVSGLQADVGQVHRFAENVKRLAKMGLNKTYLAQIVAMGPVQGGQLAAELAGAGLDSIQQINTAEHEISQTAGMLGKATADAMYDSGAAAGKGFLSGLKAQQAAITKVMDEIAKSMVQVLRQELGIASPSKVTYAHGLDVARGLALGITAGTRQVMAATKGMSAAVSLAGTRGTVPQGVLSPGGPQPIVIHLENEVTGTMDGEALWRAQQSRTFQYNIRNSGQVTGAVRPGMP